LTLREGVDVWEVVVGVTLTALLGGLVVPAVKQYTDRRSEQYRTAAALVDALAGSLWQYWKLALRVAYYGRQDPRNDEELKKALLRWDSDDAWQSGLEIQTLVSRSKRLLPEPVQKKLDEAQQSVVYDLDTAIEDLRRTGTAKKWGALYDTLLRSKRAEIDGLLRDVIRELQIGAERGWLPALRRRWTRGRRRRPR
jgi:hypothetical protein